jgi:hypothetical protein
LSVGFSGSAAANYQLVDADPPLSSAKVEMDRDNVNKSIANATAASDNGPLPNGDRKKQCRHRPEPTDAASRQLRRAEWAGSERANFNFPESI